METPQKKGEAENNEGAPVNVSTSVGPASETPPSATPEVNPLAVPVLQGESASPKRKTKVNLKNKPAAIDLKGVVKTFGSIAAVNDVSFEVPEGSVFGLIGPNGAGKTTTFSMLAGYLTPTAGEIYILDRLPNAVDELRGQVGVLPQDAMLPAQEKVGAFLVYLAELQGMSPNEAKTSAEQVLIEVEGKDFWNKKCGTLSHGMAKRVGLAQALLGSPRVILLDEPTAGLDPRVAYGVRQIVKSRKGRATLVISSHNLQELEEICDYAAVLDRGVLVAHGSMAELTASSSEIRVELGVGPVPLDPVRQIQGIKTASFDKPARELNISFDRQVADAEEMIRRVTFVLYQHSARISGISKGRGLEQRVMELTE